MAALGVPKLRVYITYISFNWLKVKMVGSSNETTFWLCLGMPAMNELQTINNENENYDIIPLLTDSGHMMLAMLAPSQTTLYYKCIKDRDFVSLTITIY